MKHTPGPWRTQGSEGKYSLMAGETAIGRVFGYAESSDESRANARLIAAAPAMLAALRAAQLVTEGHPDRTPNWHDLRRDAHEQVRAAIALAEGGE